jgi:predicted phosphodiesterase
MLVGFLGDLHSRVFLGLAVLLEWQRRSARRFDLIVQVGDLGVPEPDSNDPNVAADDAERDFGRFLTATGRRAANLRHAAALLAKPIPFVRGNHDDPAWLAGLPADGAADPFGIFRYVRDGAVEELRGLRIGYLGGVEEQDDHAAIDRPAFERLLALGPGRIDLLVTHQGPFGTSVGYRGDVHGSPLMTRLIEALEPRWHVAGHAHVLHGPRQFGATTYLGIDCVIASPRWFPEKSCLQPGCLAVLDTGTGVLAHVVEPWLEQMERRLEFDTLVEAL